MKALAALIVLAAALPAAAQVGPMIPWWDRPMRRDLGLTGEQNRQMDEILRAYRDEIARHRGAVEATERELMLAMNAPEVDERLAGEAIEKVIAARSDLSRSLAIMGLKMRQILTAEQWTELQKRQGPEWRMRMMRPGGPPGRMGGPGRGAKQKPPER